MPKYKAVQVPKAGGDFEVVERDLPQPSAGQVRLKVQACGICHSDVLVKMGYMPTTYPRVPGHEVVGVIDAVGPGVTAWKAGQRAGVGWYGGHCGTCRSCRRGDFMNCSSMKTVALSYDGGYAEAMVAPIEALALVPDDLSSAEAAPLMCAGITTFNALRNSGARAGDLVAVVGIGGLGHLGVQFAAKMGFKTAAVSRGKDKEGLARKLGAHHYVDTAVENPSEALQKMGGAKVILATGVNGKAMGDALGGLAPKGKLLVVGAPGDPLQVSALQLIPGSKSVAGWASGTAVDSEDTLNFSALTGVRPMVETFPLEKAAEAFDRMMSGKARFRVVLTTGL